MLVNVSLFQAGAALDANSRWQEVIAENMAAGGIPGYKKQQLSLSAIQAGFMPTGPMAGSKTPAMFVIPKGTTSTNFSAGGMQATGIPTDVAVDGKGFFEVQLPGGTTGYTRDGQFAINSKGELTTKEGYPVLGQAGPIQLNPRDPSPITISARGEISQGTASRGKLALAEFAKPDALTQVSPSYFVTSSPPVQGQAITSTVRQGYLEASNSSTVMEMASLMTAMRGFEANQHVIQIQDDRLNKTITELGTPS